MSSKWNKVVLLTLVLGLGGLFWDGTTAILTLAAESAPYLLLGFGLAGCLKALIPESRVFQYLGADTFTSVALAALFGIPIPLCSCSVLPVAMTLRQSGASKGATTASSFLPPKRVSTPLA
jgi:uncharacterized protein